MERRAAAMEKLRIQRAETADELSKRTESLSSSRTNTSFGSSLRTKRGSSSLPDEAKSGTDGVSGRMDPRAATVSGGSFSTPSFLNELSLESERLGIFGRMRGSLGLGSSKKKPSPDDEEPAAPSHNLVIELHKKVQTDIIGFECVSSLNPPPSPSPTPFLNTVPFQPFDPNALTHTLIHRRLHGRVQGGVGVRVHSMHAEGLAHASGVRPADVLLTIDGVRCTSPEAAAEMLRSKGAGAIRLELWRAQGAGGPAAASDPAAASPAPASCLTPRAAAPIGADTSTLSKGVDMLGGNMAELSDTLKRRGGPRGSVSFAVPGPAVVSGESQVVADAALEPSGGRNYSVNYSVADARDEPVDEQAAAREAKLRSFAEFCKRDAEEAAEGSTAEARPRAATSGVAEDMEAWLGATANGESEGAATAEGEGEGAAAAEGEGEGAAAAAAAEAEADAEGGAAAEAEGGSDPSPELIRINQGWQVRGVGTKVDSKTAVAASADDQGTKARLPLSRDSHHTRAVDCC